MSYARHKWGLVDGWAEAERWKCANCGMEQLTWDGFLSGAQDAKHITNGGDVQLPPCLEIRGR